ncbi:MAG: VOC family protein [Pyrinomonadaceae bacterium]|nr:VOC family protein [Pyrinomonadaceae bacterium]
MAKINPYLTFNGNSEEVFNFYKSVFGGEFATFMRFGDMPAQDGCPEISDSDKAKIMHVALPLSDGHVLMASDAIGEQADSVESGNNISLSVSADSKEEADKLFNGLSDSGTVTMPISDTFWGAYFGMCKDQFGINWMVNYDYPKND